MRQGVEERLKHSYEGWETEDLMKAVTIDKAQYEPIAIDLMIQEIKKRNLSDEDIEKFPETYSRGIVFKQIYDFVLEQIRIGADKWTIAKSIVDMGMDRKDALHLVETIQAQILKAREEAQQESITVKPFKDSKKDIRPLVALIFLPGLYFCLFLCAAVSLLGAGLLMYILYGLSSTIGLIPTGIMALIAIGGILGAVISVQSGWVAIKKAVVRSHAFTIKKEQAPKLFEMVSNLCHEMQASIPNNIILELGTNFFVTDANVITFDGQYDSRTLCIGAPLLHVLNSEELKGIIAHELAHFTGNDLVYSKQFFPVYRGTLTALNNMANVGSSGSENSRWMRLALIVPMWLLRSYLEVFSRIERNISRRRELRADSLGAKASSTSTMASALVKVYTYGVLWGQHSEEWIVEVLNEGKVFSNISDLFSKVFTLEESLLKQIAEDSYSRLTHPTDTHPSLKDRLSALGEEPLLKLGTEGERAVGLFPNLATLEEKLTQIETSLVAQYHPGVDREKLQTAANGG
jgi:Zn-dependent protease with chaperone function